MTRELATLLRAGLPLDRALEILIGLAPSPPVAALLQQIRDDVRGGKALSQALDAGATCSRASTSTSCAPARRAARSASCCTRLAETMERNKELRESVKSALIYPTILIGVAVVSVIVLLIFVVPQFQQTFAQAGKALPLPTQVVVLVGTFMRRWWWAARRRRAAACCGAAASAPVPRSKRAGRAPAAVPLVGDLLPRSRSRASRARWRRCSATASRCSRVSRSSRRRSGNIVLANALDGVIAGCAKARASAGRSPTRASIRSSRRR